MHTRSITDSITIFQIFRKSLLEELLDILHNISLLLNEFLPPPKVISKQSGLKVCLEECYEIYVCLQKLIVELEIAGKAT